MGRIRSFFWFNPRAEQRLFTQRRDDAAKTYDSASDPEALRRCGVA
jgi:hypothetical protein